MKNWGVWWFDPKYMVAINSHNGTVAQITIKDGNASAKVFNCPAPWMMDDLRKHLGLLLEEHLCFV